MGLRVEEDFGMGDAVSRRAIEIGDCQVPEILGGNEDIGALIIDVEKVLQAREAVGGPDLLDRPEGDVDPVPPGKREHQLGLEAALDVDVQLGFRQSADEAVYGHCVSKSGPRAPQPSRVPSQGRRACNGLRRNLSSRAVRRVKSRAQNDADPMVCPILHFTLRDGTAARYTVLGAAGSWGAGALAPRDSDS
jgi:hypothetical protein